MPTPTLELADIFRQYGPAYRQTHALPLHHLRVMQAIEACRTPLLGGVVEWCDQCQYYAAPLRLKCLEMAAPASTRGIVRDAA